MPPLSFIETPFSTRVEYAAYVSLPEPEQEVALAAHAERLQQRLGLPPPMLANQAQLPRWPVPSLDQTLARYLDAVRLTVDGDAYAATEALVRNSLLAGSDVRELQARLIAYDEARLSRSYVSDFWEGVYLYGRDRLVVHSSPGIGLRSDCFPPDATSQVQRAARMVAATLAFAHEVETGQLAPEVMRGVPLDMQAYTRMFSSCRVPAERRDLQHKAARSGSSAHVVVLRGATMWRVDVMDEATGAPLSVAQLERQFEYVVENSPSAPPPANEPPPLAVLTTAPRDDWAAARAALLAHGGAANAESVRAIDDALIHVCLDLNGVRGTVEDDPLEPQVRATLHGNVRSAPRWFDKSLCLMLSADTEAVPMALMEHSCIDGLPAMKWYREMARRIEAGQYASHADAEVAVLPQLLPIELPPSVCEAMARAEAGFDELTHSVSAACVQFRAWGASQLKAWGTSPDGAVQQAFQLAFHAVAQRQPVTYESCAMAHFAGGRTETLRPRTAQSLDFVRAVAAGAPEAEQAARLLAACKAHSDAGREASAGRGIDRHLFALRTLAGDVLPELFTDPTYSALTSFELSTSNMTDPVTVDTPWAFGPTHAQGVGVCYNLSPSHLAFTITAYAPNDAHEYAHQLRAALELVGRLLALPRTGSAHT
jgi:carnitine O-acetyltransferase